jgi:c-di-AMP phosphodiesterase-like protein
VIEKILNHNNKTYKVVIKKMLIEEDEKETLHRHSLEEEPLFSLYMFDVTRETALAIENYEQKGIVSLLYIDNYDDVLNSIEDVRRPLLIAMIDRNINKFAKSMDGVVKKFEKDKYIVVFQKKHLVLLKEEKFDILDSIRSINIGNEMSVTLSMGVGMDDKSFDMEYDYARIAMDLALGRGGDQAVIKENDKLSFYGGNTKSVEKSARVIARLKAHAFRELIDECDRMIIMGHKMQDMDSLGAAVGAFACAKHFNKPAHIIIDNVTTSVKTLHTKLIESGDYPEDLFITGVDSAAYIKNQTLLVVVDVNRPSYLEYPAILTHVSNVVVFDHHRVSAEYIEDATLSYIETYASSTCEMITEIIRYVSDRIKITPLEADALFAGISVDTKNFVTNAGVKTFEAAAFLKRYGADVVRVRKLFKNDMASYKARATAVRDAQIYRENMAISVCPSDITNPNLVGAQAADELLNISGIKASFVLTETDNQVFISARSLDEINVQRIMEKLGGGGHLSVAGAQIDNKKLDEAIILLKKTIDEFLEEGE